MTPTESITRDLVVQRGWRAGTTLENAAARRLSGVFEPAEVRQQHAVDRYRIDFAWPDVMLALEVDGWHHRSPEGAAHDALRDAVLRAAGWLVVRVDDRHGRDVMDEQVVRVCRLVHGLRALGESGTVRRARKAVAA